VKGLNFGKETNLEFFQSMDLDDSLLAKNTFSYSSFLNIGMFFGTTVNLMEALKILRRVIE